jgi:hypothetical protein
MTRASPAAAPHRSDDAAADRAARWLCELDAEPAALGALPRAWLALGLATAASLTRSHTLAAGARERANRVLDRLPDASGGPRSAGDAVVVALAFTASGRLAGELGSALREPVAAERSFRARLVRRLLGDADAVLERVVWSEDVERSLLSGPAEAVAELACAIEALGIGLDERVRPRFAAAAAARGFAELRRARGFALGTSLLRAHGAHGRDPLGSAYALAYLARQQRLDGSFGHLPPRAPEAGDLRWAFHVPRTALALWTIHDAGPRTGLLAAALAHAG